MTNRKWKYTIIETTKIGNKFSRRIVLTTEDKLKAENLTMHNPVREIYPHYDNEYINLIPINSKNHIFDWRVEIIESEEK